MSFSHPVEHTCGIQIDISTESPEKGNHITTNGGIPIASLVREISTFYIDFFLFTFFRSDSLLGCGAIKIPEPDFSVGMHQDVRHFQIAVNVSDIMDTIQNFEH